jgi:hypothetical protein
VLVRHRICTSLLSDWLRAAAIPSLCMGAGAGVLGHCRPRRQDHAASVPIISASLEPYPEYVHLDGGLRVMNVMADMSADVGTQDALTSWLPIPTGALTPHAMVTTRSLLPDLEAHRTQRNECLHLSV